ncbi:hypothetical protein [Burkholderia cepacia]|uniref:hypothetical protein n=1 Tax=Burkholderia cepacia TaxID=292 RepID=UPI000421BABE|nr:hypothetical protein [Burkholderia cepacia]AIO25918.1 hypothetical protein DM41_2992 [Burkholderia cepacia ATCC 25416]ALK18531.1 hypothetical protein APZ15_12340 [Burkholderia cepacia ATCC 25416]MCA8466856.1 hypothetical protein [Burkholderia cepacia]SPU85548.1 Tail fiber protein [Burkholderia cepacia]
MAIQNDFLPFAVGAGANVLTQSAYAALSAIESGYQAGTAQSAACNKTWRQSSIMTAVIAQFVVAQTGQAAVDDGTTAALLANFTQAVSAASRNSVVLVDTGSANAYAAANGAPFTALPTTTGIAQTFSVAHANTGASTYAPDGLPAAPIFGEGGVALQGGELVAGGIATLMSYVGPLINGGSLCWVLVNTVGGASPVAPASKSCHAAQLGQVQQSQICRTVQKAANYAVQASDAGTMFYAGAALTYQLPSAAATAGMVFGFMNQAGFVPTVQTSVSGQLIQGENLSGATSIVLSKQGGALIVMSDGANYIVLSASPAIWSPKVAPVYNSTSINSPAASTTYTTTVSFTAPCPGSVAAMGSLNASGTSASVLNASLMINGSSVSGDSTLSSQTHMGVLPILAGQTVTVTMQVATQSTAPGIALGMHVLAIFSPNP